MADKGNTVHSWQPTGVYYKWLAPLSCFLGAPLGIRRSSKVFLQPSPLQTLTQPGSGREQTQPGHSGQHCSMSVWEERAGRRKQHAAMLIVLLPLLVHGDPRLCLGSAHPNMLGLGAAAGEQEFPGDCGWEPQTTPGWDSEGLLMLCREPSLSSRPRGRAGVPPWAQLGLAPAIRATAGWSPCPAHAGGDLAKEKRGRKERQTELPEEEHSPLPLNLSFLFLSSSIISCPFSVVSGHSPLSASLLAPCPSPCYPSLTSSVSPLLLLSNFNPGVLPGSFSLLSPPVCSHTHHPRALPMSRSTSPWLGG